MEVAEMVEKKHADLLKDIRRYNNQLAEGNISSGDFFKDKIFFSELSYCCMKFVFCISCKCFAKMLIFTTCQCLSRFPDIDFAVLQVCCLVYKHLSPPPPKIRILCVCSFLRLSNQTICINRRCRKFLYIRLTFYSIFYPLNYRIRKQFLYLRNR